MEIDLNQPGCIRAIVTRSGEATKVEWPRDSVWRFMPTVRDERVGIILHPVDLAVNKVLALAGRDEARDVVDAVYVHRHVLVPGALRWAACGKDPAFTPLSVLDSLRRRGRIRDEDRVRLDLMAQIDLRRLKQEWLAALGSVEEFVASRPDDEAGCLDYGVSRRAFVDPREGADALPHHGRPGGVLPRPIDC